MKQAFIVSMSNTAEKLDLGAPASRLSRLRPQARERRRFRRLPLSVSGRILDTLGREHPCRTADISPGDVRIEASVLPGVGERVVIYLEGYGRLCGSVARRGERDIAVIFDFTAYKREKLTEQLTLAINEKLGLEPQERRTPRLVETGPTPLARIQLETGEAFDAQVLDFSLTGATLRTTRPAPPIGDWVRVGNTYGRVARYFDGGFAVDFEPKR